MEEGWCELWQGLILVGGGLAGRWQWPVVATPLGSLDSASEQVRKGGGGVEGRATSKEGAQVQVGACKWLGGPGGAVKFDQVLIPSLVHVFNVLDRTIFFFAGTRSY